MIGKTVDRVPTRAAPHANERIRRQTEMNIAYFGLRPEEIDSRLAELDTEWDIERVLETVASCLSLAGLVLRGVNRKRKWLLLTTMVQGFFLQHALQGWSPPVPLFRRLGFRTQNEIESERYALKALRGDFTDLPRDGNRRDSAQVGEVLRAVGRPKISEPIAQSAVGCSTMKPTGEVASTQIAISRLPSMRKVWFGNSVRRTTPLSARELRRLLKGL